MKSCSFLKYKSNLFQIAVLMILVLPIYSQEVYTPLSAADSLYAVADSSIIIMPDSLLSDSISQSENDDLESPIRYWADHIYLTNDGSTINLKGNAKIVYQNMTLTSAEIKIDRQNNTLYAQGAGDSISAEGDTIFTQTPIFEEKGEDPMHGEFIEYNFSNKRGKISGGKTEMEPGYYKGEQINKIGDRTLLIQSGYFTSCEYIDDPHFYFKSTKMRVIVKDKIVAEPVYFYMADVPLMWFPFAIFPNKKGRHSGLLIPTYGESSVGGRYLRGMGYYWAPSDYFDADFMLDFYDRLGFAYRSRMSYNVRYKLNGNLYGEYYPMNLSTGKKQNRWVAGFTHNQEIDKTFRIRGSGKFVSDERFAYDLSPNQDERLNQNLSSNLTVSKSWKGTKNSLSLNANHNRNLQTGQEDWSLPSLTFNRSTSTLYETFTGNKSPSKKSWYHSINFGFNSRLINKGSKKTIYPDEDDVADSTYFEYSKTEGIQHSLTLSSTTKLLKYINFTPAFRYREDWVSEVTEGEYNEETRLIETEQKKQFAARRTFSFNFGARTTMFGLFAPNIGSLKLLRHKFDPGISFNFAPDFSEPGYGYVTYLPDSSGKEQKIDKFSKSPFGGTSSGKTRNMNMRLDNLFQAKLINDEGEEKKIDILKLNFNTSYNFLKDSLKFSDLTTYASTRILGKDISVRMTHTFYRPKHNGTGKIDEFQIPRLLSLSTSFGYTIDSKLFKTEEDENHGSGSRRKKKNGQNGDEGMAEEDPDENEGILESTYLDEERRDYLEEAKNIDIPWSVSFNLNYSLKRQDVNNPVERIGMSARANIQLTRNWKIGWNAQFDLVSGEVTSQNFSIYRDLHCWEMSLGWQPEYEYYSFRINVKSSLLKDLKVTKHPSSSSRYGYGY